MENIAKKGRTIGNKVENELTMEDKLFFDLSRDPLFLSQEISMELDELNEKQTITLNYLKKITIILIIILVVLIIIVLKI